MDEVRKSNLFEGLTEEQIKVVKAALMVMGEDAWLLYEKEDGWHIAVKMLDNLEKTLWVKVRVASSKKNISLKDMCLDFESTDFDETTKYRLLWYTERNRKLLLEVFLGKTAPKDSEEYKEYERWVIRE